MGKREISLDIGFDQHLLHKSGRGYALLRQGLTVPDLDGNPVILASKLTTNDRLLITIYDLTKTSCPKPIQYMSLEIVIEMARNQVHNSPFVLPHKLEPHDPSTQLQIPYPKFGIQRAPFERGKSTVFGGLHPCWRAFPPQPQTPSYPANQLEPTKNKPANCFIVKNEGHYYFSVNLDVHWEEDDQLIKKTFRVDPEMIVNSNSPADDIIPH